MHNDPISDLIALIDPRMIVTSALVAGGDWAVRCPAPDGLKFVAMLQGSAWVYSDETPALPLEGGDVLLLNGTLPFVLAGNLAATPLDASEVFTDAESGIGKIGTSTGVRMIGGHVALDRDRGHLLIDILPAAIKLGRDRSAAAGVRAMIRRLDAEVREGRIGGGGAIGQLAQLIILDVLRYHLEETGEGAVGWLRGVTDQRIGPAIKHLHDRPEHGWHVEELARLTGMSRTAFSQRFKAITGIPPVAYLTNWRMHLAEQKLAGGARVAQVAHALGYASEAAFSQAFKRERGLPPSSIAEQSSSAVETAGFDRNAGRGAPLFASAGSKALAAEDLQ
jgi:AraC-like DNA-binding protein